MNHHLGNCNFCEYHVLHLDTSYVFLTFFHKNTSYSNRRLHQILIIRYNNLFDNCRSHTFLRILRGMDCCPHSLLYAVPALYRNKLYFTYLLPLNYIQFQHNYQSHHLVVPSEILIPLIPFIRISGGDCLLSPPFRLHSTKISVYQKN